mmetsp:Transcript_60361/g.143843  ORF Transcript_60361/g.143843 Transcript_60361/m.143843 type:complete len:888 (-) Transcript_60361:172-2835(-)|eukprot:CAMPEP_0178381560 /NCGR_PEP_ID=MMETSP0689_2-20121128/6047_1 /TAXON_ID=160604 /ORGANISM="Amphidinium massartii, Strain CS-259" /LENGTH=887 /DNA_ID=CAMNT_0020001749 /DNA_START=25 /DNA_END=2688 /DNA_ORIENTATION=-
MAACWKFIGQLCNPPQAPADLRRDQPREQKRKYDRFETLRAIEDEEERISNRELNLLTMICSKMGLSQTRSSTGEQPPGRSSVMEKLSHAVRGNQDNSAAFEFPVTFQNAEAFRRHLELHAWEEEVSLSTNDALRLVTEFTDHYRQKHPLPVANVEVPSEPGKLVVVGDTHGQLQDVLCIMRQHGPPTSQNVYVFNGDVADRGDKACEIYFLIAAYYLADPDSIVMNRGNHEDEAMHQLSSNEGGGFYDEVHDKYTPVVYKALIEMMKVLNLMIVVSKKVCIVHGGLPSEIGIKLDKINEIPHFTDTVPADGDTELQQIWMDLMWSDPSETWGANPSPRGAGVEFGPDVTRDFFFANDPIRLLIRSHELPGKQRGVEYHHRQRCITVFSASNYCCAAANKGGTLVFHQATFPQFEALEHYAPPLEVVPALATRDGYSHWKTKGEAQERMDNKGVEERWWQTALLLQQIRLVELKPELWQCLLKHTAHGSAVPVVGFETWSLVLTEVLGSHFDWETAWQWWGLGPTSNKVNFVDFLGRFAALLGKEEYLSVRYRTLQAIFQKISDSLPRLRDTIQLFDQNGDGRVDRAEAFEAISQLNADLDESEKCDLVNLLFCDPHGEHCMLTIKVDDLLERLAMAYRHVKNLVREECHSERERLLKEVFRKVAQLLASSYSPRSTGSDLEDEEKLPKRVSEVFRDFDTDGNGFLEAEEFLVGIARVPGIFDMQLSNGEAMSEEILLEMARSISDAHGGIGILRFLEVMEQAAEDDFTISEHMFSVIMRHRISLRGALALLDSGKTGRIPKESLQALLTTLGEVLVEVGERSHQMWTDAEVSDVCQALSLDGENFDYEEVLNTFQVVDSENPGMAILVTETGFAGTVSVASSKPTV